MERNLAQLQKCDLYITFLDFVDDIKKVLLLIFLVLVH